MFAVIFETAYVTKILFTGTMAQCKVFMQNNKYVCGDDAFVQEMEPCDDTSNLLV
jgi:hypothetical protein